VAGKIFINYRRVESEREADHLKTLLDGEFRRRRVFLDKQGIDRGKFPQTLEQQVAASAAMVVLIGKDWANQAIAKKLKSMLVERQRGVPLRWAGLGLAASLAGGIAAGPVVLDRLGPPQIAADGLGVLSPAYILHSGEFAEAIREPLSASNLRRWRAQ
jgi:hypothetical protein